MVEGFQDREMGVWGVAYRFEKRAVGGSNAGNLARWQISRITHSVGSVDEGIRRMKDAKVLDSILYNFAWMTRYFKFLHSICTISLH